MHIHPLPGLTRQSALSHARQNHRCWISPSSARVKEGTSELSSSWSFMNMWLLAWVSLRCVRATWDSPADRLAKDNVGDHPFASSISEAASMRNQIAKHGGSAYQLTLVLAQRTVDQIANAHAKAVATLFIAMQDWLKWPSERKKGAWDGLSPHQPSTFRIRFARLQVVICSTVIQQFTSGHRKGRWMWHMLNLHTGLCLRCCCWFKLRQSIVLSGLHLGALCVFISKLTPWIHTPAS